MVIEDQKILVKLCKVIIYAQKQHKKEAGILHLVKFPEPNRHVYLKF